MAVIETQKTKEKLPITPEQIDGFLLWYNKFHKWKTVDVDGIETTFTSKMEGDVYCINAKSSVLDKTRKYDPKTGNVCSFDNQENIQYKHYNPGVWPLDYEGLKNDLDWFKVCVPSKADVIMSGAQDNIKSAFDSLKNFKNIFRK